jgi:hypothetical protein
MDVNHKIAIFQGDNTIFNDAASVLKWVMNKVSLGATETVMGKISFTQQLKFLQSKALSYHDDNGIISAEMFWRDYKEWKSQSFSSFGAQHQNARAYQQALSNIVQSVDPFES